MWLRKEKRSREKKREKKEKARRCMGKVERCGSACSPDFSLRNTGENTGKTRKNKGLKRS